VIALVAVAAGAGLAGGPVAPGSRIAWAQPGAGARAGAGAGGDSAGAWAAEGLALLAASTADSIGPAEARAYDLFDRIARRHFQALGPRRMAGARGVLTQLDSLGIDAEFVQDAELPQFCALTFFHPAYAGHAAMTYLYWFRGNELLRQRLLLTGGKGMQMDVWWTGNPTGPYEVGLLDRRRTGETRPMYFTLLRMTPNAAAWGVVQFGRRHVDLGGPGPARLVDLNDDAIPELVSWVESAPDPRFVADVHLPPVLSERLWQRTDSGFVLFDRRTVPTPFATWVQFLRALGGGDTATARALAATPSVLTRARALGLGAVRAKDSWQMLQAPEGDRWNQRMTFLYGAPNRTRGLEVQTKFTDGHWRIERIEARTAAPPAAPATPAPAGGGAGR
jgi:hypothetical protein